MYEPIAMGDNTWHVPAESIVCPLLPAIYGGTVDYSRPGCWFRGAPITDLLEINAERLKVEHAICPPGLDPAEEHYMREPFYHGNSWGDFLGLTMANRRIKNQKRQQRESFEYPIATYRHHGHQRASIYVGLAFTGGNRVFLPESRVEFRGLGGRLLCNRHSDRTIRYGAETLVLLMDGVWREVRDHQGIIDTGRLAFVESEGRLQQNLTLRIPPRWIEAVKHIAAVAGLIRVEVTPQVGVRTALTPAGAIWYLADQRRRNIELLEGAGRMDPQQTNYIINQNSNVGAQLVGNSGTINIDQQRHYSESNDLQRELRKMCAYLRQNSGESLDLSVADALEEANSAAQRNDQAGIAAALSHAGKRALGVAKQLGMAIAASAIANEIGMS